MNVHLEYIMYPMVHELPLGLLAYRYMINLCSFHSIQVFTHYAHLLKCFTLYKSFNIRYYVYLLQSFTFYKSLTFAIMYLLPF